MRVIRLTDLHLNFVPQEERQRFYERVWAAGADAILAGGDVGEARSVGAYLSELETAIGCNILLLGVQKATRDRDLTTLTRRRKRAAGRQ